MYSVEKACAETEVNILMVKTNHTQLRIIEDHFRLSAEPWGIWRLSENHGEFGDIWGSGSSSSVAESIAGPDHIFHVV